MAKKVYAWEAPELVESDDDIDWPKYDSDDSDFDPTEVPETDGDRYVQYMVKLFDERTLNAKQLCSAMHLAYRAGMQEA